MFVSICAYCGKVRQLGRGFKSGGKTYCDTTCANADSRMMTVAGMPGAQITHRGGGGSGYWLMEDDGYWLDEDGGKWVMEDYN